MKKKSSKYSTPRGRANLTPGRKGKPQKTFVIPSSWDKFCIQYKLTGNLKLAAARSGYGLDYARHLLLHPAVQERMKQVDQEMLTKELVEGCEEFVLHAELLDTHLVTVVRSHSHERRGYADKIAAIKHGNELLGRVASGRTTINNSNSASAQAASGITARRLYLPVWRKEVVEKLQDQDERNERNQENTGTDILPPGE